MKKAAQTIDKPIKKDTLPKSKISTTERQIPGKSTPAAQLKNPKKGC